MNANSNCEYMFQIHIKNWDFSRPQLIKYIFFFQRVWFCLCIIIMKGSTKQVRALLRYMRLRFAYRLGDSITATSAPTLLRTNKQRKYALNQIFCLLWNYALKIMYSLRYLYRMLAGSQNYAMFMFDKQIFSI